MFHFSLFWTCFVGLRRALDLRNDSFIAHKVEGELNWAIGHVNVELEFILE